MYIEKDNLCTSIKSNFINTWTCNTLLESPCTYFNIFEFLHISQIGISVKNCTIDWCFIRFLIQNFFKLSLKIKLSPHVSLYQWMLSTFCDYCFYIQMLSFNPNLWFYGGGRYVWDLMTFILWATFVLWKNIVKKY